MLAPFGASAATCKAPANVAPAVMPTKMPSFCASSWLSRIASAPGDAQDAIDDLHLHASPVSFGMKSGVQPCMGCGLNAGMRRSGGPIRLARLLDAAAQQGRVFRLADDDLRVGHLLGEHARYALQSAARCRSR
jgi:hypothetical protein